MMPTNSWRPILNSSKSNNGNYDWSRYFGEEGFNPISVLIDIVKRKPKPKPLTLGTLELAVTMGN